MNTIYYVGWWIGLGDEAQEGVYVWESNGVETNYTFWHDGGTGYPAQPDSGTRGNCVIVNIDTQYFWCDISCDQNGTHRPLCMKETNI